MRGGIVSDLVGLDFYVYVRLGPTTHRHQGPSTGSSPVTGTLRPECGSEQAPIDLPDGLSVDTDGSLVFDGFRCDELVRDRPTPLYVYSADQIRKNYRRMAGAFEAHLEARWRIFYAYKGNPSPAVCAVVHNEGAGAEVISYGELDQALKYGVDARDIVFNNVVKTKNELNRAVSVGVRLIIVDSETEFDLLDQIASDRGKVVDIGFRVRPGISAGFHEHVRTADNTTKFGFSREALDRMVRRAKMSKALRVTALHVHLGSQICDLSKYEAAARFVFEVTREYRQEHGLPIGIVDLGGGMGIQDDDGKRFVFDFAGLAKMLQECLEKTIGPAPADWPTLYFEPNRAVVGDAGVLLGRIVSRKEDVGRVFVGTDTGFSAFVRPMLYGARHEIRSAKAPFPAEPVTCDVVGPLCESGDTLAANVPLAEPEPDDVLVVFDCGAYGFAQSSRYSSLPRPGEILVDGGTAYEIRRPESYQDLNRLAKVPPHLELGPSANGSGAYRPAVARVSRQTVSGSV